MKKTSKKKKPVSAPQSERMALAKVFAPRLQELLTQRGWRPDDVVRHSPILKTVSVTRYLDALRFPEPQFLIYLAAALDMTVEEMLGPVVISAQDAHQIKALQDVARRSGEAQRP